MHVMHMSYIHSLLTLQIVASPPNRKTRSKSDDVDEQEDEQGPRPQPGRDKSAVTVSPRDGLGNTTTLAQAIADAKSPGSATSSASTFDSLSKDFMRVYLTRARAQCNMRTRQTARRSRGRTLPVVRPAGGRGPVAGVQQVEDLLARRPSCCAYVCMDVELRSALQKWLCRSLDQ